MSQKDFLEEVYQQAKSVWGLPPVDPRWKKVMETALEDYHQKQLKLLNLHDIVVQGEQINCDNCKLKCDSWNENHPCATCCEFDNHITNNVVKK